MTEPSQYFKGRTVQEQMNEVIGYVDARAEEVAAAKADDVLEPAEQAKTDAIAAKEAAEDARDATLAALPAIQQDIADLKAEDVSLDGRLDTVELKVQTAEGNIVTIQGQIVALQTADGQNVKINNINQYAVGLTGNQTKAGQLTLTSPLILKAYQAEIIEFAGGPRIGTNENPTQSILRQMRNPDNENYIIRDTVYQSGNSKNISRIWYLQRQSENDDTALWTASLSLSFNSQTGRATLSLTDSQGTRVIL